MLLDKASACYIVALVFVHSTFLIKLLKPGKLDELLTNILFWMRMGRMIAVFTKSKSCL